MVLILQKTHFGSIILNSSSEDTRILRCFIKWRFHASDQIVSSALLAVAHTRGIVHCKRALSPGPDSDSVRDSKYRPARNRIYHSSLRSHLESYLPRAILGLARYRHTRDFPRVLHGHNDTDSTANWKHHAAIHRIHSALDRYPAA